MSVAVPLESISDVGVSLLAFLGFVVFFFFLQVSFLYLLPTSLCV